MKKRNHGGGASWMDTYGDMVTLLLCFFVLLYSMSSIDQEKWKLLVQSFNPGAVPTQTETVGSKGPSADSQEGNSLEIQQNQIEQQIEELYEQIKAYVAEQGTESTIEVSRGQSGEVYLNFSEAVFFDGNSYTLRDDGKKVLDDVGALIYEVRDSIDELQIIGHTAQANPDRLNSVMEDRFLASNRATVVEIYLQEKGVIAPERMVSMERGQWRPVADNHTSEGRAQNRRVEMVVTGKNLLDELGDSVEEYYAVRDIDNPLPDAVASPAPTAPVDTAAPSDPPGPEQSAAASESPAVSQSPAPLESPTATEPPPQTQSPAPDGTSD